jgi:hypothetical protein
MYNNMEIIIDDKTFKELLPIVATKEFLSSKSNDFGWFISDNFILPYIIEKKFIFKRLIFSYSVIKRNTLAISQKEFLNGVVELSKTLNIDFIYQPYAFAIFDEIPDNCIYAPFGTYQIDLIKTEDDLFKNLHSKHRNVVRKAQKNELTVFHGIKHKNECYNLIKDTLQRQQQPFMSIEDINNMYAYLGDNISFYIIKNKDKVEGSAIIISNKHEAYYLLAGSDSKTSAGAMNLLIWQIMLDMKNNGVKSFDFVGARINPQAGSKFEGIQRFKSRFGTTLKEGYLWKIPIKPFKYKLFKFITWLYYKLKNKSYSGDIIDQEIRNG